MTKILVINNYGQFCHLILRSLRDLDLEAKLVSNGLSVDELMSHDPGGLILSGGPTLERTGNCELYVREIDLPILGICLGQQLIAKTLGGVVKTGTHGGFAQIDIEIVEKDDLFLNLPSKISVWSSHSDEVSELPKDFIHLARSKYCNYEAIKHKNRPLYGVQFHPEVSHTNDGEDILLNFLRVCEEYKV